MNQSICRYYAIFSMIIINPIPPLLLYNLLLQVPSYIIIIVMIIFGWLIVHIANVIPPLLHLKKMITMMVMPLKHFLSYQLTNSHFAHVALWSMEEEGKVVHSTCNLSFYDLYDDMLYVIRFVPFGFCYALHACLQRIRNTQKIV